MVKLAKALGVKNVKVVNPYDLAATERVIKREVRRPEPSVIISRAPCVLSRREKSGQRRSPFRKPRCLCRVPVLPAAGVPGHRLDQRRRGECPGKEEEGEGDD